MTILQAIGSIKRSN